MLAFYDSQYVGRASWSALAEQETINSQQTRQQQVAVAPVIGSLPSSAPNGTAHGPALIHGDTARRPNQL